MYVCECACLCACLLACVHVYTGGMQYKRSLFRYTLIQYIYHITDILQDVSIIVIQSDITQLHSIMGEIGQMVVVQGEQIGE